MVNTREFVAQIRTVAGDELQCVSEKSTSGSGRTVGPDLGDDQTRRRQLVAWLIVSWCGILSTTFPQLVTRRDPRMMFKASLLLASAAFLVSFALCVQSVALTKD